ncbi:hypothetical protein GF376_02700 [Candidatus Peregrinibacteria bacterium]|nr:hypothetical protein [Candidatus Peregrinibacteria bacterium]
MEKFTAKEALLTLTLTVPSLVGYGVEAAVKTGVQSTRDEIAIVAQGIELNSFMWGNGSLDPTNYWTQAMQDKEK